MGCAASRRTAITFALCALSSMVYVAPAGASEPPPAVAILVQDGQPPAVTEIAGDALEVPSGTRALILWEQAGGERCAFLSPGRGWQRSPSGGAPIDLPSLAGASRGEAGAAGGGSLALATAPLDQLTGVTVLRDAGFLTPWNGGAVLNPKITVRRTAGKDRRLPRAAAGLYRGKILLARIPFAEGQDRAAWRDIPNLPQDLHAGLPPGEYVLRMEDGVESTPFRVEDDARRAEVMKLPDELAGLAGKRSDPLFVQAAVEHLLAQRDEAGKPHPYLADALDLLDVVPEAQATPYLRDLRRQVLRRLESPDAQAAPLLAAPVGEATGIEVIDRAREAIGAGRRREALDLLRPVEAGGSPADARTRGLADLYRAVIYAESGAGQDELASVYFRRAVRQLAGRPADLYRAHNDHGNFLLERAQDRLYNHAFQMAAGAGRAFLTALRDWDEARRQYEAALALAAKPDQKAAVRINLARLYSLLADVIRTLDAEPHGRRFAAGEQAAAGYAHRLVSETLGPGHDEADPFLRAAGEEVLAHLAFRAGDAPACLEHAHRALAGYTRSGSLPGMESAERLLGLARLREAGTAPQSDPKVRQQALGHLMISHLLAEVLREQVPPDRLGLSLAGFFARRAYVNEKLVELLVAAGDDRQALRYAELAKARALQDLLASGNAAGPRAAGKPRDLAAVLAAWPRDTAALEYFLGADRAWVFVVSPGGKVKAHLLAGPDGRPLSSRRLVADVRRFLEGIGFQAARMRQQLLGGTGFDTAWQDRLHDFYAQLIPAGVLGELRQARTVVVVPHHILHYFPFAALVIERDPKKRPALEMVQPRFLLEEPFNLCYAPSLTTWDLLRQRRDRPITRVAAVGLVEAPGAPALPGVEKDLQNLKAAFGPEVITVYEDEAATPAHVGALLHKPGLLLLAGHGINEPDQPLQSHLVLYPDAASPDGLLTAAEVFRTRVQSDLVVMNACYSGLADRSPLPGDDLFGLQRALLHAGARTVVSGLWDVYDGTGPEVMGRFFRNLKRGRPAAAALAEAQRDFLRTHRASPDTQFFLHPYFWAVFTAAGDDRTH